MTLIDLPAGLDLGALRTLVAGPKQTSEAASLPDGKVPAISYLRVSTKDQAALEPAQAIQTILATNPRPHDERTLPRDPAGQGSNVQLYMDLTGGLSKRFRKAAIFKALAR